MDDGARRGRARAATRRASAAPVHERVGERVAVDREQVAVEEAARRLDLDDPSELRVVERQLDARGDRVAVGPGVVADLLAAKAPVARARKHALPVEAELNFIDPAAGL